ATQPGTIMGTVPYMSPEQVRGYAADQRSDIFALGCVLYEMVAGVHPFRRATAADTMAAILTQEADIFRDAASNAPAGLGSLIALCLAKEPNDRFQSMRELVQEIGRIQRGDITTHPDRGGSASVAPHTTKIAIAVLPFVNLSSDEENQHFSDGL